MIGVREQLLTEVGDIIDILEARIPANVSAPVNQKHVNRLEKGLQDYFKMIGEAFPYGRVFDIYIPYFYESSVREAFNPMDVDPYMNPLLDRFSTRLAMTLKDSAIVSYLAGSAQTVAWVKANLKESAIKEAGPEDFVGAASEFEGPPIPEAVNYANNHISEVRLVDGINEGTKKTISKVIGDGIENKRGVDGLARDIKNHFDWMGRGRPSVLPGKTLTSRARMIARTETNDALSQAFMDRSRDMGIEYKEWIVTYPCPICEFNEAEGVVPMDHIFSSGHERPPAHPNAVFEGYNFYPYGSLNQMVSSLYDGPAVSFEAERLNDIPKLSSGNTTFNADSIERDIAIEHINGGSDLIISDGCGKSIAVLPERIHITIGPNHPVLTRRGFVDAQCLSEGDELLYDGRCELTTSSTESDFKQIHPIEDVFESIASVSGYTNIPAASDYFHGDEMFCDEEIKVIRPKRELLNVTDIGNIEHLSKCNLTGAYTHAKHVAGCTSCQLRFNSVFHSPPRNMCCFRITSIHSTSFSGLAYDASTTTELYSIGGLVVKNCRCALAPARKKEEIQ